MAVVPFLTAILAGWLLVRLVRPAEGFGPRWAALLVEGAFGAGAGIGLTSWVYFGLLLAGAASPAVIVALECLMVLGLAGLAWRRRSRTETAPMDSGPHYWWIWLLLAIFALSLFLVLASMLETARSNPYGEWDGWAIWNLRARYLAAPGEVWRNAISPLLSVTHPDYPLLTSGFIAQAWKVAGSQQSTLVPIATGFLFAGSVLGLLVAAPTLLRGASLGLLAGLAALSNVSFVSQLTWQYADVPLAFYYIATLVAVFLSASPEGGRRGPVLALAGLFASLAAWTKDEGIVFAVVVLAVFAAAEWWPGRSKALFRHFPWLAGGALPGLLIVAGFKLFLVPKANPMFHQEAGEAVDRVLTWPRLWNLAGAIYENATGMGIGLVHPLLILAILAFALGFRLDPRHRRSLGFGLLALAGVFAGYCIACLSNPTLLKSRYYSPFDRMFTHLWPSFVLLVFMGLSTLEEIAPEPRRKKKRSR